LAAGLLLVACPVLPFGAALGASDHDEFKVKREGRFDFARKPVVTREGDKGTIEFETKAFCDVTVAVEDETGRIVRHLGSGVLGSNAPEPFQKNSKRQRIIWDGKNDQGQYIDDKERITIRVSLGLRALFERTLFWSPYKRYHQGSARWGFVGTQGGLPTPRIVAAPDTIAYGQTFRVDTRGGAAAEVVLVGLGSMMQTARAATDQLRQKGEKVGVVNLRVFRPFPSEALARAVERARVVLVLDRDIGYGTSGMVYPDVTRSLYHAPARPQVLNFIIGTGGKDITPATVERCVELGRRGYQGKAVFWPDARGPEEGIPYSLEEAPGPSSAGAFGQQ